MHQNRLIILAIVLVSVSLPTHTFASGSYSRSRSSSFRSGSDNYGYQKSKSIFYKDVICDNCPFPGRGQNSDDARIFLQELNSGIAGDSLSSSEQQATISYLKRRFSLY